MKYLINKGITNLNLWYNSKIKINKNRLYLNLAFWTKRDFKLRLKGLKHAIQLNLIIIIRNILRSI